jgi:Phage XkdN-like protein.
MAKVSIKEENVEVKEFTKEETKNQTMLYENDFINGLLAAADYRTSEEERQKIEIIRNEKLYFAFSIRPLGEEEYDKCKSKHTKYVRNKQLGIKLPEDTNTVKYRAALIYQATIEADRELLWDNKKVWSTLNDKGHQVLNALDVIEVTLRSGEKDAVIAAIDRLSGYESNLEEVAKN